MVLKYPRSEYPSLSEVLRYRHEFDMLRRLESPHVLRALRMERSGHRVLLVTEDFGGVTLRDYFRAETPTLARFLELSIEIVRALAFVHDRGVIHRDVHPANVLVDPRSGTVKLIDFGIATLLSREAQELKRPEQVEGTFTYMSPEQTGRMNRTQDYRSDYYSLGATLYALAKGEPPFSAHDVLELIHCHIAKEPSPLHEEVPWIPETVSAIVAKLLAKAAEHRYQSAHSLLHDLQECQTRLRRDHTIAPFPIATRNTSPRFEVPKTLYGRAKEQALLLEAFERVVGGQAELVLVGGYSGIGKSALVNELHKSMVAHRGYFIQGKFDQYRRDVPYSALTEAFHEMVEHILREPPERVEEWRTQILEAVGANAGLLIGIIPRLELLLGPPPPVIPLPAAETRLRLDATLRAFVDVLAQPARPLVLFLDDLQWADPPSLHLLEVLLRNAQKQSLLIIAAYRDNEVDVSHPMLLAVEEILQSGASVQEIKLGPIAPPDVTALVAATVHGSPEEVLPLSTLLHQRTGGNPFFLVQLLRALHEARLFTPKPEGGFGWDMRKILAVGWTDSIIDLMASRLDLLPEATRRLLRLAACIGSLFDLGVLSRASGFSPQRTAEILWPALLEGLVLPVTEDSAAIHGAGRPDVVATDTDGTRQDIDARFERAIAEGELRVAYRFLHDRVQQATYGLIPPEEREAEHLKLGRLLLGDEATEPPVEQLFQILPHLNLGLELVTDPAERHRIARLNFRAGHRAKAAAAFKAAAFHYAVAMDLLGPTVWSLDYRLALDLHREAAECEYIVGNFARSDELAATAIACSKTPLDKAGIYTMRVQLHMSEGTSFPKATELAIEALGLLGYTVPATTDARKLAADAELAKLERLMEGREISALEHHVAMTDPTKQAAMDLFMVGWGAAYLAQDQTMSSLMAYLMVTTSLEHGHTTVSPFGYVIYGLMVGLGGDYPRGYQLGQLAMRLNELYPDPGITARAGNVFAHSLNPYFNPLETNLRYYKTTYKVAPQVGEMIYVVWAVLFMTYTKTMKGDPLPDVFEDSSKYLGFLIQSKNRDITGAYLMHRQMVRALQGLTREPDSLDEDGAFSEAQGLAEYEKNQFHSGKLFHGVFRTGVHVIFNNYRDALESARVTEEVIPFDIGMAVTTNHHFYQSLAVAALYGDADEPERERSLELFARNLAKLSGWAETAPMNFAHRRDLVAAELARCRGDAESAARLYERSIDAARAVGFIHDEALASETAAYFYLGRGFERIARLYMSDASYAYMRWGADGKVADLEQRYGYLLRAERAPAAATGTRHERSSTGTGSAKLSETLDFGSLMKAAQAISRQIEKQALVDQLMRITLENAGARRGWLVLDTAKGLMVIASAAIDSPVLRHEPRPLELELELSPAIVRYVVKTHEALVLHAATREGPFRSDRRVLERQCKSIVAVPLVLQGRLTGVLCLENDLVEDAFTPQRVEVVQLLAAQAAISLENASLYEELEARVAERTQALAEANRSLTESLDQLHGAQRQLAEASRRAGMADIATSVLHNIGNVLNSINVSSRVVMDATRDSKLSSLSRLASLIAEQEDIGAWIAGDERGKRMPQYLRQLADTLVQEHARNLEELESLQKNIDHIKVIVSMQQQHAKFGGVIESLSLQALVEDAIRLNVAANERVTLAVTREFDPLPMVSADRHKIFQILMNLLSNARHAVQDNAEEARRITVRVRADDAPWVAIEVEDCGCGIAPENLIKIFNLGFTTKREGHGFGLHSSSCAAIEMGGTLTAHSDGPGRGALFRLLLPLLPV